MRPHVVRSLPAMLVVLSLTAIGAQSPPPVEAIDGVDVVLLLKTGKETFGKTAFKSDYGRFTYLFASAETKAEFDAAPERYAIQMNGLCARMGRTANGNPSNYAIAGGRIYIFASDDCHKAFVAAPDKFIAVPAAPLPADAAAATRGRELLDRAAAAHGGSRLDGLTGYREIHLQAPPAQADPPLPPARITTSWRFPDAARAERSFTMRSGQQMSIATVLSRDGGWSGPATGAALRPLNPASVPSVQHDLGRLLVPLLRNRTAAGTRMAALGEATVDGVVVERVRVVRDGLDVTVNVDPRTGRVHSTSSRDRNQQGEFGEFVVVYGDFRDTAGVLVPFTERVQFDGVLLPAFTRTLESAELNPALGRELFTAGGK